MTPVVSMKPNLPLDSTGARPWLKSPAEAKTSLGLFPMGLLAFGVDPIAVENFNPVGNGWRMVISKAAATPMSRMYRRAPNG